MSAFVKNSYSVRLDGSTTHTILLFYQVRATSINVAVFPENRLDKFDGQRQKIVRLLLNITNGYYIRKFLQNLM